MGDPALVRLIPGASDALAALAAEGWKLIIVSNQSGVGRGLIGLRQMEAVHTRFLELMQSHGVPITDSLFCTHSPEDACECRKPSPFLLKRAADAYSIDLGASWMIGDREADILCGRNAGCSTIWLRNDVFRVRGGAPRFRCERLERNPCETLHSKLCTIEEGNFISNLRNEIGKPFRSRENSD